MSRLVSFSRIFSEDVHDVGGAARRRRQQQRAASVPAPSALSPSMQRDRAARAPRPEAQAARPGQRDVLGLHLDSFRHVISPAAAAADVHGNSPRSRRGRRRWWPRPWGAGTPAPPGRRAASAAAPASPPCPPSRAGIEEARPRPAVMKNAMDAAMSRSSTPATSHQCSSPENADHAEAARHEQPVGHRIDEGTQARGSEAARENAIEQIGDRRQHQDRRAAPRVRRQQHEGHREGDAQRRAEIGDSPSRTRLLAPRSGTSFGHLRHPRPSGVP